jgi:hypothetical protein
MKCYFKLEKLCTLNTGPFIKYLYVATNKDIQKSNIFQPIVEKHDKILKREKVTKRGTVSTSKSVFCLDEWKGDQHAYSLQFFQGVLIGWIWVVVD